MTCLYCCLLILPLVVLCPLQVLTQQRPASQLPVITSITRPAPMMGRFFMKGRRRPPSRRLLLGRPRRVLAPRLQSRRLVRPRQQLPIKPPPRQPITCPHLHHRHRLVIRCRLDSATTLSSPWRPPMARFAMIRSVVRSSLSQLLTVLPLLMHSGVQPWRMSMLRCNAITLGVLFPSHQEQM